MVSDELLTSDPGGLFLRLQERYGLGQDPLAMDVPFFPGAQRQYSLETLRHLAAFGDMAILVTGARGAGKTRMLAELVRGESNRLDFQRLSVSDLVSEQGLADRLLSIAHHGLGDGRSPRDAIYAFFSWSEKATQKGRRIVLVVDDADHGQVSLLNTLISAYCKTDRSQSAVPVLAGSDTLVQSLGGDLGLQGQVHQIHMRPLTREELAAYLRPRIERSGGDPAALIGTTRLKKLHELSQGSFGRLKRTAPAVWLDIAGHQPVPATGKRLSMKGILIPVSALVLLSVSWLVVSWQYDSTVASQSDSVTVEPEPERVTVRLGPDADVWSEGGAQGAQEIEASEQGAGSEEQGAVSERLTDRVAAPESKPFEAIPLVLPEAVDQESPVAEAGQTPDADLDNTGSSDISGGESVTRQDEASVATGNAETASPAMSDVPADPAVPTKDKANPPQPEPITAESDQPADGFKPGNASRFESVNSLRSKSGLTAQFIAGYEERTALEFLSEHPDVEGLVYTRSARKGKPWYVVVYGEFSSRDEARSAISELSGGLSRHDVWIRSLSGL